MLTEGIIIAAHFNSFPKTVHEQGHQEKQPATSQAVLSVAMHSLMQQAHGRGTRKEGLQATLPKDRKDFKEVLHS
jgi:hypothetical protein